MIIKFFLKYKIILKKFITSSYSMSHRNLNSLKKSALSLTHNFIKQEKN